MSPDVSLAVVSDVHDASILGIELPYGVVAGYASVLAESHDDFVL